MTYDVARLPWLPAKAPDFSTSIKAARALPSISGASLRDFATQALDLDSALKLSKLIETKREAIEPAPLSPLKLAVLSSSTTSYTVPAIRASAPRHGVLADIYVGDYGQTAQEIYADGTGLHSFAPDVVLLSLDAISLGLTKSDVAAQDGIVDSAAKQIRWLAEGIVSRLGAAVIIQNFVEPADPWAGHLDARAGGSLLAMLRKLNREIETIASDLNAIVLDVDRIAGLVGKSVWSDRSQWYMAKLPFALDLTPLYADHVARLLGAVRGKTRKCLVLDLDNTCWGGIIGDDGVEGIRIGQGSTEGEAFLAIQHYALDLKRRGIVLAVCSKNEEVNACLPFDQHEEMALKRDDIAVFVANWTDKATNLKTIAQTLNIGTDALLFLDDNPAERARVRQMLPEVAVPEVGEDPAHYPLAVAHSGWFETVGLTADDAQRAEQYRANAVRAQAAQKLGSLDEYLESLEMVTSMRPFDENGRARIAQLVNKSNQFNLTTRRYTEAEVGALESDPDVFTLQIRLADKFGDNGMIAVVVMRPEGDDAWACDTWLMSCRVLGRRMEEATLQAIVEGARAAGIKRLIGRYIPTAKNGMVAEHFGKLGFTRTAIADDGASEWEMNVDEYAMKDLPFTYETKSLGEEHVRIDA
ncbi:FkbH-like protein [Sphingomonas zeicaulis]|uniref:HAD-IIIC family phosphatase n=1 Tax=Sphingomonas zeicaulis TaxID=1632740 RepID=UPI003D25E34F